MGSRVRRTHGGKQDGGGWTEGITGVQVPHPPSAMQPGDSSQ